MLILIYSFSIPFTILTFFSDAFLRGIKRFNYYVKITIVNSILVTSIMIILVFLWGVYGIAIGLVVTSLLTFLNFIFFIKRGRLIEFKKIFISKTIDNVHFKSLLKIGFGALLIGLASYFTIIFLRSEIIRFLGLQSNGLYQTVYSISINYLNIFFTTAAVYTIPILSELKSKELMNSEINSFLRIVFIVIVPILTTIFVFREYIILILFSQDFLDSAELFFFNFLGDFARLIGTVFGLWLIPANRIKALILINFSYNGLYIISFFIILFYLNLGLVSITIAYFIANVIFFFLNWGYMRKSNSFKFTKINLQLLLMSSSITLTIFIVSNYYPYLGYILIVPVIIVWFFIAIKKDEYLKIKEFVINKIR